MEAIRWFPYARCHQSSNNSKKIVVYTQVTNTLLHLRNTCIHTGIYTHDFIIIAYFIIKWHKWHLYIGIYAVMLLYTRNGVSRYEMSAETGRQLTEELLCLILFSFIFFSWGRWNICFLLLCFIKYILTYFLFAERKEEMVIPFFFPITWFFCCLILSAWSCFFLRV